MAGTGIVQQGCGRVDRQPVCRVWRGTADTNLVEHVDVEQCINQHQRVIVGDMLLRLGRCDKRETH